MMRTYRTGTALAASLSLLLPNAGALAQGASGQAGATGSFFCTDGATPPCAQEPQAGMPLLELPIETLQALVAEDLLDDAMLAPYGLTVELLGEGSKKEIRQALKAARKEERKEARKADAPTEGGAAEDAQAQVQPEVAAESAQPEAETQAEADVQAVAPDQAAAVDAQAEAAEAQAQIDAETAQAEAEAREAEMQAQLEAAEAQNAQAEAEAQAQAQSEAETAEAEAQAEAEARKAEMQAELEAAAAETAQAEAEAQAETEAETAEAEAEAQAETEAETAEAEAEAETQAEGEQAEAPAAQEQAAANAEATAAAPAQAEAEGAPAELTPEERAERRARRAARRAERRAQADQEEVDPTANAPQQTVAAASNADAQAAEEVVETEIDEDNSRQSDEEFEAALGAEAEAGTEDDDDGLSNFQKALLVGIGAVAVGSLLNNGREVVANTGDRVVVEGDNGLEIYRDDDALLRQPGADLRTETFADGSTRSTLTREDGTQVVTIRSAEGRVLRRSRIFADGTEIELFDDLTQSDPVDVRSLREMEPEPVTLSIAASDREALLEALRAEQAVDTGRSYSLRQVREIQAVRALVPAIDLDTLTFDTGSAALRPEQAGALVDLGLLIEDRLAENPREVFLIEGHTDAVGNDAYNLALSDRRAETVALALSENFDIAPENLVVQGYGERYLKVQSEQGVEANRRATVRRITPLLQQVASAQ